MKSSSEATPLLRNVISSRFANATAAELDCHAKEIFGRAESAASYERLERSDKNPAKDKDRLEKSARHLQRAASELNKVGWYGSDAIFDYARNIDAINHRIPFPHAIGKEDARLSLIGFIEGMAVEFQEASLAIDPQAESVLKGVDVSRPAGGMAGRPMNTTAFFTAVASAKSFEALAGTRPTRIVDEGISYSFFLDFLGAVFDALGISASVDESAKDALHRLYGQKPSK